MKVRIRVKGSAMKRMMWSLCALLGLMMGVAALWRPTTAATRAPSAATKRTMVRAEVSGTLAALIARPGMRVEAGQTIAMIQNEALEADVEREWKRLEAAQGRLFAAHSRKTKSMQAEINEAREALRRALKRSLAQRITAPQRGTVVKVRVKLGDQVANGAEVFEIANSAT